MREKATSTVIKKLESTKKAKYKKNTRHFENLIQVAQHFKKKIQCICYI